MAQEFKHEKSERPRSSRTSHTSGSSMSGNPMMFLVFLCILVAAGYFAASQPSQTTPGGAPGFGDYFRKIFPNLGGSTSTPGAGEQKPPEPVPPAGFTKADLSPYFEKIIITFAAPWTAESAGEIVLQPTAGYEKMNLMGWRVKGGKGSQIIAGNVQRVDARLRISIGKGVLQEKNDRVLLFDTNGLVVDEYVY